MTTDNLDIKAIRERASVNVGTTIDRWLRENPDTTPEAAKAEFQLRYETELINLSVKQLCDEVGRLRSERDEMRDALLGIARQLDEWAKESWGGGWSTHQVKPMRRKADELRRIATAR